MKTIPDKLLQEAEIAVPPLGQAGKWAPILPAVEILLSRHFSLTDAIEWLVKRGAVSKADRRSAYYSVSQRLRRSGGPAPRKQLSRARALRLAAACESSARAVAAIQGLVETGETSAEPGTLAALEAEARALRVAAIQSLAETGETSAETGPLAALEAEARALRIAAIQSLAETVETSAEAHTSEPNTPAHETIAGTGEISAETSTTATPETETCEADAPADELGPQTCKTSADAGTPAAPEADTSTPDRATA